MFWNFGAQESAYVVEEFRIYRKKGKLSREQRNDEGPDTSLNAAFGE